MRSLMWFRCDLRTRDNTALWHACRRSTDSVVGVFTICPSQWLEDHDWSNARIDFLVRNLASLENDLGTLNIPLRIVQTPRFDGVEDELLKLAEETGCSALYMNREYAWNEAKRDEAVATAFMRASKEVHAFTDQVVFAPGDVLTQKGDWYTVFTPFKKRWRDRYKDGDAPESLGRPKKQPAIDVKSDDIPKKIKGADRGAPSVRPDLWKAGETHALSRLKAFIENRADDYDDRRDIPSENGTSTLSPYLSAGVLSPRQCLEAALNANGGRIDSGSKGIVTWIEELIWREFYKHVLAAFPRVSKHRAFKREMESVRWRDDDEGFEAWREGRTGYPIVDAGMRQLAQSGWMHNRLRMVTAMFLTKHLLIDWRRGEKHFMRTLVDGDLASNNGGGQWAASTGTDAQPYFRIFNPTTQGERFDPDGVFIRKFVPELAAIRGKAIHAPSEAGLFESGSLDYPPPIVDHREARERALKAFKEASGG
ncbi:MAG: deoxyribodipyrimidine photo-lyase [Phycisphaerae bacterium]|nr:deoxyribodipyrimidine photo-lyase [Phycisphaerae bacterium]